MVAELALSATWFAAERLVAHPHAEVRRAVQGHEATPRAALTALVTGEGLTAPRRCLVCDREEDPFRPCDGSHESTVHAMWEAALRNPATPTETVVGVMGHPSMLLRWALAARQDLPRQVFTRLAADPTSGVRVDVAENPAIDEALIGRSRHPEPPSSASAGTTTDLSLQRRPAERTVQSLGAVAGQSCSRFVRRFTALVGSPPLAYLTWWRMTTAGRDCCAAATGPSSAWRNRVGCVSEVAFAKAFKRAYGTSPGRYRRRENTATREP
ncbi:helix-turn-helix domain-containing protein [Streptomyces flaveolus]|uniref:helix-turn-helix domain-containing protein n=1 Tax=Streptomyces flaveolus TaxID=67297 RepID=UPI0036AFABF7